MHYVTIFYKTGNRAMVGNYRPIFLLCSTSKVLERKIYNKCYDLLDPSLPMFQFEFCKNNSSLQQLLLFYHNVLVPMTPIYIYIQLDIILLDLAKVFGSVPHKQFLLKVSLLGVSGSVWL